MPSSVRAAGLFETYKLGPHILKNRLVMAPMTRCRALNGNVPGPLHAVYYGQRASAGLIITEATQVSPLGVGYPNTPGIHSWAQIQGWKKVTDAVHAASGKIFLQLWHVGRVSHSLWLGGQTPVSSSAAAIEGQIYTPQGMKPYETPRALTLEEIPQIVAQYKDGAKNALSAEFDGVEIHGANGYLPDQFLRDGVNKRTDAYGGSVENRARFLLEVTKAAVDVWGGDRVGVRLSPSGTFNGMKDSNPEATFGFAVEALDKLGAAYIHIIEGGDDDVRHGGRVVPTSLFRPLFKKTLIVCGDYTREKAEDVLEKNGSDLVAFGKKFLANPDLPRRFKENAPLNSPDEAAFYGGTEKGYTDYPSLS